MDQIKNFFRKKKTELKFKTAGPGYRLGDSSQSGPTSSSSTAYLSQEPTRSPADLTEAQRRAAEAAMSRLAATGSHRPGSSMSRSQRAVKDEAKRQVDLERIVKQSEIDPTKQKSETRIIAETPLLGVSGILFTCELLDPSLALPKQEMIHVVEEYLQNCFHEDPLVTSTVMIYSLNTKERRDAGVSVLLKYLENIIDHPEDETYCRIRMSNKVFQNKIADLKGGVEFLKAVGFAEKNENEETFLVFDWDNAKQIDLASAKQCLLEGKPVPLKLYRNPKILRASCRPLAEIQLPAEFFGKTPEELRKEQSERAEMSENLLTLRTKEMRERDEIKKLASYKYALIRVRFPDEYSLQGTFSASEKLSEVYEFVRKYVTLDWAPFTLKDSSVRAPLEGKQESTLLELRLCPAALLYFQWDVDVIQNLNSVDQKIPNHALKDEFLNDAVYE
ncbi:unnamed protein product [Soboliphyme baturini]|uniref:UBX domain-containing protein n=1 Tax=Soboliphyme baturini TaxID=241478 RepID=A0A183IMF8_9BILA|nr:unnamed protein product [Soboliphyme baturini]